MLTFTKADTLAEIRRIGLIAVLRAPSEELALGMGTLTKPARSTWPGRAGSMRSPIAPVRS